MQQEIIDMPPLKHDTLSPLTPEEQAIYEWQMWTPGFGEPGQQKLKSTSVLISRVGGLGSIVAYQLAAAGIGKLVLAHGGQIKPSDLNRQILMTYEGLGRSRVASAKERLLQLNPRLDIQAFDENISSENCTTIMAEADLVIDCAPLFAERFAMNDGALAKGIPLIECAMYELEAQLTTIIPGQTPCLRCIYPETPPLWKREFPVFGAVSGTVGCMAAMEAIKLISGLGTLLTNTLLTIDLRTMSTRKLQLNRNMQCAC
ncbi:HesA/MoeB/ThiF family protein [Zooshikella sp. RANM57]|uniref:HesA/MoeB/ThiF family protein n=1 Tax=Zooshikella sp. RANM57 TaxID=3425863 RepID=UPI003D70054B